MEVRERHAWSSRLQNLGFIKEKGFVRSVNLLRVALTSPLSGPLWPMGLCHSSASKYSKRVLPMGEPPAAADAMAAAAEGLDVDTPIVSPEKSIIQRRDKKRAFAMTLSIPDPAAEEEDGDVRKYSIHTPASVNARLGGGTASPGGAPWQAAEGYLSAGPLSRSGNRLVLPTIMSDRASDVGSPVPPMGRLTPLKSPMRSPKPARVLRPPPTPSGSPGRAATASSSTARRRRTGRRTMGTCGAWSSCWTGRTRSCGWTRAGARRCSTRWARGTST